MILILQLFGLERTGAWRPEVHHDLDDLDHIGLPCCLIPQLLCYVTHFARYKIRSGVPMTPVPINASRTDVA